MIFHNPKDNSVKIVACKRQAMKLLLSGWLERSDDSEWAYFYAMVILKKRWPEAEPYIMKNPKWAYRYARYILKKRWPKAEQYIMKDPVQAYLYAKNILKKRWPKAEPYIQEDPHWWEEYKDRFGIK